MLDSWGQDPDKSIYASSDNAHENALKCRILSSPLAKSTSLWLSLQLANRQPHESQKLDLPKKYAAMSRLLATEHPLAIYILEAVKYISLTIVSWTDPQKST